MTPEDRSVPTNVRLVVHYDPDSGYLRLVGVREGPAGSAAIDLGPEVRLSMDYADPGVVNEILLMPDGGEPSPELAGVLGALLGDEATGTVLSALRAGTERPVRLDEARLPITSLPGAATLGRVAVLQALSDDGWLSVAGAGAALLEAARLLTDGPWTIPGLAESHVEVAAGILLGRISGPDNLPPGPGGSELVALCRWAARAYPSVEGCGELGALAARLPGTAGDGPSVPPAGWIPSLMPLDIPMEPAAPTGPRRPWAVLDGSEVHVHTPDFRAGLWARAFNASPAPLLLGIAPVRAVEAPGGGLARLLVPPGLETDDLRVDLTDEPEAPKPSDLLQLVRRGLVAGRAACRHERFADAEAAAELWAACAAEWEAAGDPAKAAAAARYAVADDAPDGGSLGVRSTVLREPFLSDRLSPPPSD